MSALFLSPPSFDGFDGGAGSRYQARREVTSFWYPTWLAQPAALVPGSRLLDCPPHGINIAETLRIAKEYDHVIINTSTPSLKNDSKVAEAIKAQKPSTLIGFVGAHTAVLPTETLKASGLESDLFSRWAGYQAKYLNAQQELSTITHTFLAVPPLIVGITNVVVLSVGALHVAIQLIETMPSSMMPSALAFVMLVPANGAAPPEPM